MIIGVVVDLALLLSLWPLKRLEGRVKLWRERREAHRGCERLPKCTATRIYDFGNPPNQRDRWMHGKVATCNIREDHSDGPNLWVHYDPRFHAFWTSGPEAFK